MRERFSPCTSTTDPRGCAAGTHQPFRSTPSEALKATSSNGSWKEAGVRPAFSLSGNWNRRVVARPASQNGAKPKMNRATATTKTAATRLIHRAIVNRDDNRTVSGPAAVAGGAHVHGLG